MLVLTVLATFFLQNGPYWVHCEAVGVRAQQRLYDKIFTAKAAPRRAALRAARFVFPACRHSIRPAAGRIAAIALQGQCAENTPYRASFTVAVVGRSLV